MESLEKRQLKVLFPAVRRAYEALTTGGYGSDIDRIRTAAKILREANEAVMREQEWTELGQLKSGSLFTIMTEGGLYLKRASFKDYKYLCTGVGDGATYHFSPSAIVREIQPPAID